MTKNVCVNGRCFTILERLTRGRQGYVHYFNYTGIYGPLSYLSPIKYN
ncbi:IS3 family transposase [Priestia megaterium]